ncbi:twin-arginine translocation pathway signal [Croceicoccus ponticola]|uniref:Twin-arginine translocation pathway signal n=1 Tax=Croceicoccus ponticola TaxID=2217664 RepID=A0A437GYL4_9SPHN|nr:murein L,D-transpeptidase catalytic domain family protein [Croceicoccus ponticola]RVQ67758.1 twin-arginine translocation pathway signal [Croceicoccus ponticola]
MVNGLNRRNILKGAIAAGATLALPMRTFAQASPLTPRDRAVLDVAKREIERAGSAIWRKDVAAIADYGVHSALPRFHFANVEAGTVRSFLVAHGTGSDPEHDGWLNEFSNTPGSNATSRGSYVTYEWYRGKYGTSIRLGGLDPENSNALPRAIVAHSADYARASHISQFGRLGRSNGCFAMSPDDFNEALWHLSGGRLIYSDRLGLG